MSRFLEIAKGTKATKVVDLPLAGEAVVKVAIRPLNGLELGHAVAEARAYALSEMKRARPDDDRPLPEPKEGDRLYDLGHMVAVLAVACEDPDQLGAAFFGSKAEILEGLDADRIALLYAEQEGWQDHCSPRSDVMGAEDFWKTTYGLAQEDEGSPDSPFDKLRPALRRSWARITARLLMVSQTPK